MSEHGTSSRAADLAARQVESIVAAAEAGGEQLKEEARREADQIRAEGRREALALGEDARRQAEKVVDEAQQEAAKVREQTRRQVEGRVAAAEEASASVLEEARTLSSGLRQLGSALQNQGERILRDVQAAHKRMQADLRVGAIDEDRPAPRPEAPRRPAARTGSPSATPEERAAIERAAAELGGSSARPRRRERGNPFDDLEVPTWVGRER